MTTRARIETPLKQVLKAERLQQTWLADQLGVDKGQVFGWVHGLHLPAQPTRQRIADAICRETGRTYTVAQLFGAAVSDRVAA